MTEVYSFSEPQILLFFLVLIRMSTFVFSWPVFGIETIPAPVKILFSVAVTLMIFPTLSFTADQKQAVETSIVIMTIREALIGVLTGALARFFFFAFQIAGDLVSMSVGLASAQMYNPAMGGQTSSIEQFYLAFATLFYLGVNGHHFLLTGLVDSYSLVPISSHFLHVGEFAHISHFVSQVVEIGLKFSAPVLIAVLVVNVVMGIIGKTIPQMNVLVTSFPINILCGFAVLFVTLPLMTDQMADFLELATTQVFKFVRTF